MKEPQSGITICQCWVCRLHKKYEARKRPKKNRQNKRALNKARRRNLKLENPKVVNYTRM